MNSTDESVPPPNEIHDESHLKKLKDSTKDYSTGGLSAYIMLNHPNAQKDEQHEDSSYIVEEHLIKSNPLRKSGGSNSTPKAHRFQPEKGEKIRSKGRNHLRDNSKVSNSSIPEAAKGKLWKQF